MRGQFLLAAGLFAVAAFVQRWSTVRQADRRQIRQVDVPRWENEGGAPRPGPEPGAADGGSLCQARSG